MSKIKGLVRLSGKSFASMLYFGINNLAKYEGIINDLNVFPVPDGDTGTNMLLTLHNAFKVIDPEEDDLEDVVEDYAKATVYGARGNSGVIISQFFRGISEEFSRSTASPKDFAEALLCGYRYAYKGVGNPTEGTILTVMREAATLLRADIKKLDTIDDVLRGYICYAKRSLNNTPNLLPVLKKAGVVDSGGAGLVYLFEGMLRYLEGKELHEIKNEEKSDGEPVDFSKFDRNTRFDLGYCTEVFLQLTGEVVSLDTITEGLRELGDSLVTHSDGDKVKVHIHTKAPETVLAYLHKYGEFLTLKIENMSVQHENRTQKYLLREVDEDVAFSVIAVSTDEKLQKIFSDMGADVVIYSEECPSANAFLEAYKLSRKSEIIVFPNSPNSILSSMQAATLYADAHVTVLNSRSVAECYSALAYIDYSDDLRSVVRDVNETLQNIYEVPIARAVTDRQYGDTLIRRGDFFATSGKEVLSVRKGLYDLVCELISSLSDRDFSILTVFITERVTRETLDMLRDYLSTTDLEYSFVNVDGGVYELTLSFE